MLRNILFAQSMIHTHTHTRVTSYYVWLTYQSTPQVENVQSRGESSTVFWHSPSSDSGRGRWKDLEKWDEAMSFSLDLGWQLFSPLADTVDLHFSNAFYFQKQMVDEFGCITPRYEGKKYNEANRGQSSCEIVASFSLFLISSSVGFFWTVNMKQTVEENYMC